MHFFGRSSVLAGLAVAAAAAGCGSSDSGSAVGAGQYMRSVCNAVAPWVKDVTVRANALNFSPNSSAAQRKKSTQDYLDAVVADSRSAVAKIKAAGTPNVGNGKAVASAIVNDFNQLESTMAKAASQARSLPTNNLAAFNSAAHALGNSISSSIGSLGSLRNRELTQAAAKEPACKQLGA
jgi:hypothetical protein